MPTTLNPALLALLTYLNFQAVPLLGHPPGTLDGRFYGSTTETYIFVREVPNSPQVTLRLSSINGKGNPSRCRVSVEGLPTHHTILGYRRMFDWLERVVTAMEVLAICSLSRT